MLALNTYGYSSSGKDGKIVAMAKLHTYALIKALYDQNKDYFDAVSPLVLGVMSDTAFESLSVIQGKLRRDLGLEIPIHILKTTCARAKSRGYADQDEQARNFRVNESGKALLSSLESLEEVKRRTNAFLASVARFFSEKGTTLNQEQAQALISSFIEDNLDGVIDFVNPKKSSPDLPERARLSKHESATLVEFVESIHRDNPEEYARFTELVLGSVLASLLCSDTSSDIVEAESKEMKRGSIFFDTNITFSLLGFHSDESNLASQELLTLLKSLGFGLKIFDFTLEEIGRVMNGYITNQHKFPSSFRVDHIYSVLRKKGWGTSDVRDFLSVLDEKVEELGIEIHSTNVNLIDYKSPKNEALRSRIAAGKREDIRGLSTTHDLAAVDKIREIRKKPVRRIEDTDAFFLTSDFSLQKAVLFGLGHHDGGTLSEVILDRVLANILWLKNPNLSIPLSTIIATHSRDLLIDRRIWDKFYQVLTKLRTEGRVTDGQIENLFYHNNIENVLKEFKRGEADKVDESLVIEEIEVASESISEEKQAELAKLEATKKELFDTQEEQGRESEEHADQLIKIRNGLRRRAEKTAGWITGVAAGILTVALWVAEFLFFVWWYPVLLQMVSTQYSAVMDGPYGGLGFTVGVVTLYFAKVFRDKASSWLKRKLYKQLLKDAALEDGQ